MARKSRISQNKIVNQVDNQTNLFKTAIYARLSAENSNKKEDREVIANQIETCKEFISNTVDLDLTEIYVDNGYSGTNFERPSFTRLMDDIKMGKINCIVIRDLSRFGRDYIETGTYLERIFPALNIRFIAVHEGYDNFSEDQSNEALMIPLQNMINNLYAKDISRKVATAHRTRMLTGDFKRSTLPYGYKLDDSRRNVEIDEETANYVRLIFKWRLENKTIKEIINLLEENGAVNPQIRKKDVGVRVAEVSNTNKWHYSTIQNILKNHTYIGKTVIGKKIRAMYKGIPCVEIKDENQWIFLNNTHEPIVCEKVFFQVQDMNKEASIKRQEQMEKTLKKRETLIDFFANKLYCGDCGSKMGYSRRVYGSNCSGHYHCSRYKRKLGCASHTLRQDILNEKVLNAIQTQVKVAIDYEVLIKKLRNTSNDNLIREKHNELVTSTTLKVRLLQKKRTKLYEDYVEGLLDEDEYLYAKESYDHDYLACSARLEEAIARRKQFSDVTTGNNKWIKLMKSISRAKKINQSLVDGVIERVLVYENGEIDITMKYADIYKLTTDYIHLVKEGETCQ